MSLTSEFRLAELMTALSVATDLGMGQPMSFAQQSCILSMRLGAALGLPTPDLRDCYYQSLLRYIGCNATTHELAAVLGDEIAARSDFAAIDLGNTGDVLRVMLQHVRQANAEVSLIEATGAILQALLNFKTISQQNFNGHCEVAQRLAQRIGFGQSLIQGLGQLYERWDGRGLPHGIKGENITVAVRVVTLAQDVIIAHRSGGVEMAVTMAQKRRAGEYDPNIADVFCQHANQLCAQLESEPTWDELLALEPAPPILLSEAEFDNACLALADFADIKSPHTLGHSRGVSTLAEAAARQLRLPQNEITLVRRAALLHDIGRVGISAGIWAKSGQLNEREWSQIRMHTYYTECVLARPARLAELGKLAGLHHERLDGSGYHRNWPEHMLSMPARILAAADVFQALLEARPYRPAYSPEQAAAILQTEVAAGKLDASAVHAVLSAAGIQSAKPESTKVWPNGLTQREVEVIRLIARGNSTKQIAAALVVSPKTVDNQTQSIYAKLGISSRAAAALFAVEHHLL